MYRSRRGGEKINEKGNPIKRIVTLDILRGLSMLALVTFHAVDKTMYPGHLENYSDLPIGQLIIFGFIFYFASWRALFVIISAIANTYAYEEALRSGVNPIRHFLKQIFWSILLLAWGIIVQLFFNPYSGINDYIVTGVFNWNNSLINLNWSDALETIAVCLFITTVCQLILSGFKSHRNGILKIVVYGIIALAVFILRNPVLNYFETRFGLIPVNIVSMPQNNFKEVHRAFWMGLLIGYQEPLFPYLATFAIGNIFGILLSAPNLSSHKKKFIIGSYSSAVIFVALGFLLWILRDNMYFGGDYMIPPDWFFFIGLGFQIIVITAFLHAYDFSRRAERRVNRTKLIRRAGLISLTIFTLQPLDLIPRAFLTLLFEDNYIIRGSLDFWPAILCGSVVLLFWIGLIALWGLINYILSIDYIFVIIRRLLAGKKVYLKDPLRSREIIYDSEPLFSGISNEVSPKNY